MTRKTRTTVLIGVLSALAFVLYFAEIPLAFLFTAAPYLKIDFSDVPAILAGIAAGPIAGTAVELIKNILHFFLISKEPMASGEIANFFAGVSFLIPCAIMIRRNEKFSPLPYIVATICSTIVINIINYYVSLPLYGISDSGAKLTLLIYTFVPFNLLKGVVVSLVTIALYSKLKGYIKSKLQ